jgi:DNA-binding NtrC family response regulator
MPYRATEMGLLVATDPQAARRRIVAALEAARGDRRRAAASLGIGLRSWHRYVSGLGLAEQVAAILAAHGRGPGVPAPEGE